MLNITLITVGKLKEKYLREACAEYEKRLRTSCKLSIIELAPQKLSDSPSDNEKLQALSLEGKKIAEKIPRGSYVYTMCIEGKQRNSEKFARELMQCTVKGFSSIVFIIGGSFGLSDEVKKLSSSRFSMSEMTFPHQVARVMLLEQIYRAMQINLGTKYHK
ncbi:MAG: 23S rRNA (pseudouridine(1915)-N(3))-methyltransferase RlmH [Clostridia bacterium]